LSFDISPGPKLLLDVSEKLALPEISPFEL